MSDYNLGVKLESLNDKIDTIISGSIVPEVTIANAVEIRDIEPYPTNTLDLSQASKTTFLIRNTHDQELIVYPQFKNNVIASFDGEKWENYSPIERHAVIPANSSTRFFILNSYFNELDFPILDIRWILRFNIPPTLGSTTLIAWLSTT